MEGRLPVFAEGVCRKCSHYLRHPDHVWHLFLLSHLLPFHSLIMAGNWPFCGLRCSFLQQCCRFHQESVFFVRSVLFVVNVFLPQRARRARRGYLGKPEVSSCFASWKFLWLKNFLYAPFPILKFTFRQIPYCRYLSGNPDIALLLVTKHFDRVILLLVTPFRR
jgi:hypothetical protein